MTNRFGYFLLAGLAVLATVIVGAPRLPSRNTDAESDQWLETHVVLSDVNRAIEAYFRRHRKLPTEVSQIKADLSGRARSMLAEGCTYAWRKDKGLPNNLSSTGKEAAWIRVFITNPRGVETSAGFSLHLQDPYAHYQELPD